MFRVKKHIKDRDNVKEIERERERERDCPEIILRHKDYHPIRKIKPVIADDLRQRTLTHLPTSWGEASMYG